MLQRTLASSVHVTGVGLHSGERVILTMHPADVDTGIRFRRTDLEGEQGEIIALSPLLINDTRLSSTIVTETGVRVGTIEHIMSALSAMGIDNVLIELNAPEIPIMDAQACRLFICCKTRGLWIRRQKRNSSASKKRLWWKTQTNGWLFCLTMALK